MRYCTDVMSVTNLWPTQIYNNIAKIILKTSTCSCLQILRLLSVTVKVHLEPNYSGRRASLGLRARYCQQFASSVSLRKNLWITIPRGARKNSARLRQKLQVITVYIIVHVKCRPTCSDVFYTQIRLVYPANVMLADFKFYIRVGFL